MDSMKAARIISAISRAIEMMECIGSPSFTAEAERLEKEALKPLMEEYAKDE